jgi:hypothetical protein
MLYTLFNKLTGLKSPAALGTHWEIIGFQVNKNLYQKFFETYPEIKFYVCPIGSRSSY